MTNWDRSGPYIGVLDMQIARVSAALPGAGAWDAAPLELVCAQARNANLHLTYTRGAAGGAFDFQVQYSPYSIAALVPAGGQEWLTMSLYGTALLVGGQDNQSLIQREYITYEATAAGGAEAFHYGPIDLAERVERIRIRARESGVVGTPGTLQIEITLG